MNNFQDSTMNIEDAGVPKWPTIKTVENTLDMTLEGLHSAIKKMIDIDEGKATTDPVFTDFIDVFEQLHQVRCQLRCVEISARNDHAIGYAEGFDLGSTWETTFDCLEISPNIVEILEAWTTFPSALPGVIEGIRDALKFDHTPFQ